MKAYIMRRMTMLSRERMQERFLELVQIYSPSGGEKEQCQWLMDYFKERGIEASIDEAGKAYGGDGGNIIAHVKGEPCNPPFCFVAHLDQIEPCKDVRPVVDGHIIRTDGTTTLGGDDKGAVASILEIVEDIVETNRPHKEFYIMFTVSEETSMQGTKHMDPSRLPCKNLVIADATGPAGIIAYKAPAMEAIRCSVRGRKAHAGIEPEKGINAVVAASRAISRMHIGRIDQETTSNIGRIEGGAATNIVTDEVTFTAEIRSHSMDKLRDEATHMEECLKAACLEMGAAYEMEHELAYPSLEVSLDSDLYRMTAQAMEKEGIEPRPMVIGGGRGGEGPVIGGGSDGNILAGYGCSSLILSVGMMDVHTVQEALDMDELWKATRVMSRMTEL